MMYSTLDQIATFSIVLVAVVYLVWRLVLPARIKARVFKKRFASTASCGMKNATAGCAGGCMGCIMANAEFSKQKPVENSEASNT